MNKNPDKYNMLLIENSQHWDSLLVEFDDANIYQTWNYAKIVQNEKLVHHLAIYKHDDLIGIAQVRIKTLPLFQRGIAYIFSGPLWRRKDRGNPVENFYAVLDILKNEYVSNKKLVLRIRPFIFSDEIGELGLDHESLIHSNFYSITKTYNSLLLNLNDDLDVINKNLKPRWRNYLNQSSKNGLQITAGYNSELFQAFIQIYNQMMARKNFTEYVSPEKLAKLNDLLDERLKLKIFIAYKDNLPVAGLVGTAVGHTGIYLVGATNDPGLELRGSYLLHWEMIKWMKSSGCLRYDLGGINKERNPGGYKFKSGISTVEISDLGTFETSGSFLSKLFLTLGERIYKK